jgi:hypothetical protein
LGFIGFFCLRRGLFVGFAFAALVSVCLRWWAFLDLFACAGLVRLVAYGVGLSLISYWFISVAPVLHSAGRGHNLA